MVLLNRALLWTACAVFLLGTSNDILAQAARTDASDANPQSQQSSAAPQTSSSGNSSVGTANVPANSSPAASDLPDSPSTARAQATGSGQPQESAVVPQEQKLQRPVGTAAAEAPRVNGVTAARPAGVAIAPAKQHRVRTILIRTGAILGAGAALGTVIALTAATPSKPPGAH